MHVFHAYAAYKPVFKRSATVILDDTKPTSTAPASEPTPAPSTDEPKDSSSSPHAEPQLPVATQIPQFTVLPPQTSAEVLGEVHTLFYRILQEIAPAALETSAIFPEPVVGGSMPEAWTALLLRI
ncbi:hypothetical protein NUW54_g12842 [Trametes sanguinea]|uniref:Uncharacterized protein n=1 Tax=Trametes sanguinea TaxID=158606 RepID=A0ACC1MUN5_9APHY|nr:hypothetical protein NUW54_g12842 [Trametes sanguinea]